ncbi:N-acetylmannosamine kinase [Salmonella enterica subsp. enterica serovar Cerro str. FSL R8-0235]|nr:N-acetylmannosamine kinase [Salmonella enterica subsp. enterica serovar Cerro str. FSL R8-0235]
MTTLAIDIGGTKLAAALIDKNLRISQRRELPTPASKTPDALREALKALVEPLRAEARQVAIASTGIIQEGMLLALNPHNLGGLLHFPLVQTLETIAGLPTLAVNDAQAAAWAEYHALPDDIRDMVFITVSTGVGGGVVCDGKLLTGKGGLAGHLGHTLADPHGPHHVVFTTHPAARDDLAGCDAKTLFIRAGEGHQQARHLVSQSAQVIARMIADVKAITDCQCVVIGGSVGLAEGYLEQVRAFLMQEPEPYHVALSAARYRHDAGLLGAALLAQGDTL